MCVCGLVIRPILSLPSQQVGYNTHDVFLQSRGDQLSVDISRVVVFVIFRCHQPSYFKYERRKATHQPPSPRGLWQDIPWPTALSSQQQSHSHPPLRRLPKGYPPAQRGSPYPPHLLRRQKKRRKAVHPSLDLSSWFVLRDLLCLLARLVLLLSLVMSFRTMALRGRDVSSFCPSERMRLALLGTLVEVSGGVWCEEKYLNNLKHDGLI